MNIVRYSTLLLIAVTSIQLVRSSAAENGALGVTPDDLSQEEEVLQPVALKESHRDDFLPVTDVIGTMETDESIIDLQDERVLATGSTGIDCSGNKKYFKLVLRMDAYAFENKWTLMKKVGKSWARIAKGPPAGTRYQDNKRYTGGYCLAAGTYKFEMTDKFKDGMHAGVKGDGGFVGYVNGVKRFSSPTTETNWSTKTYQFRVAASTGSAHSQISQQDFTPKNDLDNNDQQWLTAHNTRRKKWHTRYGKSYVPLVWNNKLASDASMYARELLSTCGGKLVHANTPFGENMASNLGTGSWGEKRSPEEILVRWVDKETNTKEKAHLTQALWRSSKFVGCGTASKAHNDGNCHVQVCRYARPGNCNMGAYNDWQTPTFEDDSPCTPFEP